MNHGEGDEINAKMCKQVFDDKPVLTLIAMKNIRKGDEIRYDYGVENLPWKKKQVDPSFKFFIRYRVLTY